jgi:hypothetical protein
MSINKKALYNALDYLKGASPKQTSSLIWAQRGYCNESDDVTRADFPCLAAILELDEWPADLGRVKKERKKILGITEDQCCILDNASASITDLERAVVDMCGAREEELPKSHIDKLALECAFQHISRLPVFDGAAIQNYDTWNQDSWGRLDDGHFHADLVGWAMVLKGSLPRESITNTQMFEAYSEALGITRDQLDALAIRSSTLRQLRTRLDDIFDK